MPITRLNLGITTCCSLHCRECCCSIPYINSPKHQTLEAIKRIAVAAQGIPEIIITGGEPMLHPDIVEIVQSVREWSGCSLLAVATNARFPERALPALQYVDVIQFTVYGAHVYPDQPSNVEDIDRATKFCAENPLYAKSFAVHKNRFRQHKTQHPHGKQSCGRASTGLIASAYALFYGCCVAPGVRGAIGVRPEPNWRKKLLNTPLPCYNCRFGLGEPVEQQDAPVPWDDNERLIAE